MGYLKIPKEEPGAPLTEAELITLNLFRERQRQAGTEKFEFPFKMFRRFCPVRLKKSKSGFSRCVSALERKGELQVFSQDRGKSALYSLLRSPETPGCCECGFVSPGESMGGNCPACGAKQSGRKQ